MDESHHMLVVRRVLKEGVDFDSEVGPVYGGVKFSHEASRIAAFVSKSSVMFMNYTYPVRFPLILSRSSTSTTSLAETE